MEFYVSILPFDQLFSISQTEKPTKTPESPMQNLLANRTPLTPQTWFNTLGRCDPEHNFIVTEMSLYKEQDSQHEFIVLVTQPRDPHPNGEEFTPVVIRVSRTIAGNSLPARLGLWGLANDTVTVLGDLGTIQIEHDCMHRLTWEPQQAPMLQHISHLIILISNDYIPGYHLFNSSCYIFALAIMEAANLVFNGIGDTQQPHFLTR